MNMSPKVLILLLVLQGVSALFPLPLPSGIRVCFKAEGGSQCQGARDACSGFSSHPVWSPAFRDDTDDRAGGCTYTWRTEEWSVKPNKEYRLCFQEIEHSSGQCGGASHTCTGWVGRGSSYTAIYRDDTDKRPGGCQYQWRVEERPGPLMDPLHCRVIVEAHSDGTYHVPQQCFDDAGRNRIFGKSGWSRAPYPTPKWHDDTDSRWGWCDYRWGLQCITSDDDEDQ